MRLLPASVLLVLAAALAGEQTGSAIERFQSLQAKLRESRTAKDWPANLAGAKQLKDLLNEDPASLLEVARAQVHVGDFTAAFHELEQFVRMGQSTDLLAQSPDFAALRNRDEFAKIQSGMEANRSPISLGSTAFQLPDSGLLAEDVDYDPSAHRFLVTSVREEKIVAINASGASSDFVKAPDNWPMLAVKVDQPRHLVWATEVALQGFSLASKSDWGRSVILCYDLKSGKLLQRVEGPKGSALGDMALMANGDVIVSDGDGGGVYRLAEKSTVLNRLDNGDFLSPQTPAMHPDGEHIFVPDYLRGIAVLDILTKQVRWFSTEGKFALNGIDGLYFDRGRLIAIQNGTSPERVVIFTLDATLSRIEGETIIERSSSTLGDPTHGVIVGKDFYYLANSGWDSLDDHGEIKPGAKPSASRMMRAVPK
jgi:hypothetical protein